MWLAGYIYEAGAASAHSAALPKITKADFVF
jgi:hypothetical protein